MVYNPKILENKKLDDFYQMFNNEQFETKISALGFIHISLRNSKNHEYVKIEDLVRSLKFFSEKKDLLANNSDFRKVEFFLTKTEELKQQGDKLIESRPMLRILNKVIVFFFKFFFKNNVENNTENNLQQIKNELDPFKISHNKFISLVKPFNLTVNLEKRNPDNLLSLALVCFNRKPLVNFIKEQPLFEQNLPEEYQSEEFFKQKWTQLLEKLDFKETDLNNLMQNYSNAVLFISECGYSNDIFSIFMDTNNEDNLVNWDLKKVDPFELSSNEILKIAQYSLDHIYEKMNCFAENDPEFKSKIPQKNQAINVLKEAMFINLKQNYDSSCYCLSKSGAKEQLWAEAEADSDYQKLTSFVEKHTKFKPRLPKKEFVTDDGYNGMASGMAIAG